MDSCPAVPLPVSFARRQFVRVPRWFVLGWQYVLESKYLDENEIKRLDEKLLNNKYAVKYFREGKQIRLGVLEVDTLLALQALAESKRPNDPITWRELYSQARGRSRKLEGAMIDSGGGSFRARTNKAFKLLEKTRISVRQKTLDGIETWSVPQPLIRLNQWRTTGKSGRVYIVGLEFAPIWTESIKRPAESTGINYGAYKSIASDAGRIVYLAATGQVAPEARNGEKNALTRSAWSLLTDLGYRPEQIAASSVRERIIARIADAINLVPFTGDRQLACQMSSTLEPQSVRRMSEGERRRKDKVKLVYWSFRDSELATMERKIVSHHWRHDSKTVLAAREIYGIERVAQRLAAGAVSLDQNQEKYWKRTFGERSNSRSWLELLNTLLGEDRELLTQYLADFDEEMSMEPKKDYDPRLEPRDRLRVFIWRVKNRLFEQLRFAAKVKAM